MTLLDARRIARGHGDQQVAARLHCTASVSGQGNGLHPDFPGRLHGQEDVRGIARGGDADKHVALLTAAPDLPGKDLVIAVIVGHSREIGGVDVKGLAAQRRTIIIETAAQLCSQVLGIRGTAAIAAEQDLAASLQGLDAQDSGLLDPGLKLGIRKQSGQEGL